ncbi:hypothetical protein ACQP1P_16150 [Dactylosporangium sp. CA-052675]|uniref:hypothetical protein n=1 Tax=Dactylosporangium sp. CA-052675 TaxID=3239927 RepID=UPI003D8A3F90
MAMIGGWVQRQASALVALQGQNVGSWQGIEMAVRGDDAHFEFGGPDVPCLQLLTLRMTLADNSPVVVTTYQDDDGFGLAIDTCSTWPSEAPDAGYRLRALPELPTGRVQEASTYLDGDLLAEVMLRVEGRELLLVAGEADEDHSGRLVWHRLDESVLVFTRPGDAEAIPWVPARTPLRLIERKCP